jgi:Flp pilus assembly protein TadD
MKTATLFQQATALEQRGDLAGAIADYRKVLARDCGNVDALSRLGRAHCQRGEFEASAA